MTQLSTGDTAPDFTLTAHDGAQVRLGDLQAQSDRGVIVYFYPKAATPGCTTEACDFRDNLAAFVGAGYAVVGVSADPLDALQAFAADNDLSFPLLSDSDQSVARAYGSWGEKTINGNTFEGVLRSTFVLGTDGVIQSAQYDVQAQGHVAELRAELLNA